MKVCQAVEGCEKKHYAKGMCNMHYKRVRKGEHLGGAESLRQPLTSERIRELSLTSSKKYNQTEAGRENRAKHRHNRRANQKGSNLPKGWYAAILIAFPECLICGAAENLTIDHVLPLALGGKHEISNMQTLCHFHNSQKGKKFADYRSCIVVDVVADGQPLTM